MSNHDGGLFRAMAHGTQAEAREALATLFGRHAPDVTRFLRRMLGNDPMAEDLTHDTFLTAARNANVFQGGDARPWLLTLAARRATDEMRSRRRRTRREHNASKPEVVPTLPDTDLEAMLARLPTRERAALELRFVDGLQHVEVARVLGVSLRTAKTWSSDGLERLRGLLGEEGNA
tara:strand:+ start:4350 stop:4877 length:528 start_codon:yes stop_codon:yes gene_type:complete